MQRLQSVSMVVNTIFALEYERTPKARRQYFAIRKRIEAETEFEHFLYLVSNHDLLTFW